MLLVTMTQCTAVFVSEWLRMKQLAKSAGRIVSYINRPRTDKMFLTFSMFGKYRNVTWKSVPDVNKQHDES